jgi:hypothetical protein
MNMGMRTIPGAAIAILLSVTIEMPCRAAVFDWPTRSPSAVKTVIPENHFKELK